jgi:hypothetical protein
MMHVKPKNPECGSGAGFNLRNRGPLQAHMPLQRDVPFWSSFVFTLHPAFTILPLPTHGLCRPPFC